MTNIIHPNDANKAAPQTLEEMITQAMGHVADTNAIAKFTFQVADSQGVDKAISIVIMIDRPKGIAKPEPLTKPILLPTGEVL